MLLVLTSRLTQVFLETLGVLALRHYNKQDRPKMFSDHQSVKMHSLVDLRSFADSVDAREDLEASYRPPLFLRLLMSKDSVFVTFLLFFFLLFSS